MLLNAERATGKGVGVKEKNKQTKSTLACENIRFSSLFPAGDVSRETSPAAKSEEKRMFSQAKSTRGQNIYEKRHPYSLSSIGSKPTKNFKNKKEKKKWKKSTHKADQKINLHANQEQEICLLWSFITLSLQKHFSSVWLKAL